MEIMPYFQVILPPDADVNAVIIAAGGNPDDSLYLGYLRYDMSDSSWTVVVDSRDALDNAAQNYLQNQYQVDHLNAIKSVKLSDLANQRFSVETGGITLPDGTQVATDRTSQALLTGAYNSIQSGAVTGNVTFKSLSGWVTMTTDQLVEIFNLVSQHVQICFNHEGELALQIAAAADETALDAVDITAGWIT